MKIKTRVIVACALALLLVAARTPSPPKLYVDKDAQPKIYPDYCDVVIPPNIAPLNFYIEESGDDYRTTLTGVDGETLCLSGRDVRIPVKKWRRLLDASQGDAVQVVVYVKSQGEWARYREFSLNVSRDPIDEWLSYRLVEPGYDYGGSIRLAQRDLTSFTERVFFDTRATKSCVNCHAFQDRETKNFMFHYRKGSQNPTGGTIFSLDGDVRKISGKIESLASSCSYPAWRPVGSEIVFSSNKTFQIFHTLSSQKIEVFDTTSDLVILNPKTNTARTITRTANEFETFPNWSQDGKTLYYASAHVKLAAPVWQGQRRAEEGANRIEDFRYNIYKREFDEKTLTFSEPTLVVDARARERSAVHPKISPDGKWLVYTQMASGTFPLWRPEADLWIKNLATGEERPLEEVNDRYAESYHAWSSSGRWLAFSSRREDGQYARVYLAHIDDSGRASKPFVTPQANPLDNRQNFRAYNVPEFIVEPIPFSKREIFNAARGTGENTTGSGQARTQNSAEIETYFN